MPTCPSCFTRYPAEIELCSADGMTLVPDETFAHVDKDIEPGTVVGEYTIESKLGEGGFGTVYRAVHPLIGKTAAVKVLARQFSSNPQMVSRFVAEARAVNQIRHRNIIDIFSFGQLPDGRQYYIMELLEGTSLDDYLREKKRLSILEALTILRGVARALDSAHAKGLLHRDLKPENVFLVFDEDGGVLPKLLDFGLVKLLADESGHKTKTGTPMGTPYYMSPEQCRGLEVDSRTDVYSFGAMLFQLLTGEVPYKGESTMDILLQHMTSLPPSASDRFAELPPSVDSPIAHMMAKDPKDRPAHVVEALDLFAGCVGYDVPVRSDRPMFSTPVSQPRVELVATASTIIAEPGSLPGSRASSGSPRTPQTFSGEPSADLVPTGQARAVLVAALALVVGLIVVGLYLSRGNSLGAASATPPVTRTPPVSITSVSATAASSVAAPVASGAPVAQTFVDLRIDGAPAGATVSANDIELGVTPGPFKLEANVSTKLVIAAKGHRSKELTLTPTENLLLPVELEKSGPMRTVSPAATPAKSGTIHSDLEGFDKK